MLNLGNPGSFGELLRFFFFFARLRIENCMADLRILPSIAFFS